MKFLMGTYVLIIRLKSMLFVQKFENFIVESDKVVAGNHFYTFFLNI